MLRQALVYQSVLAILATLLAACELGVDDDEDARDLYWTDDDEAPPGARGAATKVTVRPGPTRDAERIATLPVARSEGSASRRIAVRLGPDDLPQLARGDVLMTPAEVEVTTRCDVGQSAPGCDYNPSVAAQLILTGRIDDKNPDGPQSKALSAVKRQRCTKAEHHCRFVFRPSDTLHALDGGFDLPCVAEGRCFVNLVMWAWDGDARSGGKDVVLVGENEGNFLANGVVQGGKARLMAIRERGLAPRQRIRRETSGGGALRVPTTAEPTLVYSLPLAGGNDLVRGEQYVVEAKMVTEVDGRARFSTKMFLTRRANDADGGALDGITPGAISEHNGVNCTAGTSPCTTRRVAVFRVTRDLRGPVYVNVFAKSAVPGGGDARVVVRRGEGWLRSTRYRPEMR